MEFYGTIHANNRPVGSLAYILLSGGGAGAKLALPSCLRLGLGWGDPV